VPLQEERKMKVYAAIAAIAAELCEEGIGKGRTSTQGYQFRGVDDVYAALAPKLAKHRLVVLPRMTEHHFDTIPTKHGTVNRALVRGEFDFVHAEDGSKHTVSTYGEGSDSLDKATNKAMSAAYKYACFQAFCVPVAGVSIDSEGEGEDEVPPTKTAEQLRAERKAETPEQTAARKEKHHKSFTDAERAKLNARLEKLQFPYYDLCEFLQWFKGDKYVAPSAMTGQDREAMVGWFEKDPGGAASKARANWLMARAAAAGEREPGQEG
jgi:hypothetical protein